MRGRLETAIAQADGLELIGSAENALTGRSLVGAGGFDVLLCDLGLPDGSGIDLIGAAARQSPETDILVITMFADQTKVIDSIRAGARGYLLKDQRVDECIEAIREIRRGGSPISPIIARQLLRRIHPEAAAGDAGLTEREREVLNLLSRGFSYAECAELLSVTANTIGSHVKSIYRKLEVNSRAEALFEASNKGILDRP